MLGTLAFMVPLVVLAAGAVGWGALVHLTVALATALLVHGVLAALDRTVTLTWSSTLVAGAIVALSLLHITPLAVTAGVAALAIVIKYVQGKFLARKHLNPAATAKVLVLGALHPFATGTLEMGTLLHAHHRFSLLSGEELGWMATWIYGQGPFSPAWNLLLWKGHSWMGGVSALATLVMGLAACYALRLKWRISLSYLFTMAVLALAVGLATGGDLFLRVAFHVFTGSVIFLAFFMATEPQSTPMPEGGQVLFGVLLGLLTFALQLAGILGGSVMALVALNLFTPLLDRVGLRRALGERKAHG